MSCHSMQRCNTTHKTETFSHLDSPWNMHGFNAHLIMFCKALFDMDSTVFSCWADQVSWPTWPGQMTRMNKSVMCACVDVWYYTRMIFQLIQLLYQRNISQLFSQQFEGRIDRFCRSRSMLYHYERSSIINLLINTV